MDNVDFYLDKNLILESNCELEGTEYALFGVPFDSTCSYRPGCRFGPLSIRREFLEIEKPDSFFQKKICDLGNINVVYGNLSETNGRTEETVLKVLEKNPNVKLAVLGGEHSLTYPVVKALSATHKDLQVFHLDAHADLMDDYLGEKLSHATVMRRVSELGIDVVQSNIRCATEEEQEYQKSLKKELGEKRPTYISLDLDVLEPGHCPGVGTPAPGGIIIQELLKELKKAKNVIGFDIVECCPPYDCGDVTAITAAKVMLELMR